MSLLETASPASASTGYTVLARRYRSRDFEELIGQEPIARTLQNAIATGRTAHAYLFCGTRGVGKTSMARIFAKALNVTDDLTQKNEIAEAILRGEDLDVIEIDGASNRGVNEARDLIASAGLKPARCRYKIYIIDEVHALTKDAFNALLKTMEEPPPHVKFILCTTEANKVPATIQSRCQRFDFRPIPTAKIAGQLRSILAQEEIEADDDVVAQVAHLGNGSMRDALSLLDRLLSAADGRLSSDLLEQMIGLPDQALIAGLVDAIIAGDAKAALNGGAALLQAGASIEQIFDMLAEHLRNLLIIATCGQETDLLEISGEAKRTATRQAANFDPPALVHLIAICDAVRRNAPNSTTSRALLDAALVRMSLSERFADVGRLLSDGVATPRPAAGKKKAVSAAAAAPEAAAAEPPARPSVPLSPGSAGRSSAAQPQHRAPAATEVKSSPASSSPGAGDAAAAWQRVLDRAGSSPSRRAKLAHLVCTSFDGTTLRLAIDEEGSSIARFLRTQVDALTELARRALGRDVRVALEHAADDSSTESCKAGPADDRPTGDRATIESLPAVRQAMDIFDAAVVDVRDETPPQTPPGSDRDEHV